MMRRSMGCFVIVIGLSLGACDSGEPQEAASLSGGNTSVNGVQSSGGVDAGSGGANAGAAAGVPTGGIGAVSGASTLAGGSSSVGGSSTSAGGSDSAGGASGGASLAAGGSESSSGGTGAGGTTADPTAIIVPSSGNPDERHLLLRDEGLSQLSYVDLSGVDEGWTVAIPEGRDLQLVGNNSVMIGTLTGYEERSMVDGSLVASLASFPDTITARRLRNGNTLLVGAVWQGEAGIVLLEVDESGVEQRRISYPTFDYIRLVRPISTGNFLLTSDDTVFEGDPSGNVVWQIDVQFSDEPHSWKALRLPSGETMIATGYEASLQVFDAQEMLTNRIQAPASVTPNFFCDFQILPSGNIIVVNWQGHGEGLGSEGTQIIELDTSGNLIWSWQQDASFISSIQGAIMIDGLDLNKLHVEDTTGELLPVD